MAELKRYKLGELIEVTRGASLAGENYATEGELMRLTLGHFDFQNGGFKNNTSKDNLFFNGEVKPQFILKKGDIITPLTEQTPGLIGSTARIPVDNLYIQSQDVGLIKCKEEFIDDNFCYYLLPSDLVKKQLSAGAQQTKIRHTSPDKIKAVTVFIPQIEEQKYIGQFLATIDKRIELLNQINSNLSCMARQIYDYWFVQFDFPDKMGKPYKSSGGEMVWNSQLERHIPKGWQIDNLLRIADFTNGLACQKFRPQNGEKKLPVIKIKEMHDGFTSDSEWVRDSIPSSVKVDDGDILFSWSASLEVIIWALGKGGLNQHIFKVLPNNGFPKSFVFYTLLDYVEFFKHLANLRKTTMGHITRDHINQSRITIPDNSDIIQQFDSLIRPLIDLYVNNNKEIILLRKKRNELVPLLLNGQVTIG